MSRAGELGPAGTVNRSLERLRQIVTRALATVYYENFRVQPVAVYRRQVAPNAGGRSASELLRRGFLGLDAKNRAKLIDVLPDIVDEADRVVSGHVSIFGLADLPVGNPVEWNRCLPDCGTWPMAYFASLRRQLFGNNFCKPGYIGDILYSWELGKHIHWLPLGRAYCLTGKKKYRDAFLNQLESWQNHASYPCSIHWMNGLLASQRGIVWLLISNFFISEFAQNERLSESFVGELYLHGKFVYDHQEHYLINNNHLFSNIAFLYLVALAFPEFPRANEWLTTARRLLTVEFKKQVFQDGVNFEQSSIYHRYVAEFALLMLLAAEYYGQVEDALILRPRVEAMLDFMMWIASPSGDLPVIGDNHQTRVFPLASLPVNNIRDLLAIGAVVFDRGDFKLAAGDEREAVAWLFGEVGLEKWDQLQSASPDEFLKVFPDGGFFAFRDGWSREASSLIFDCGYIGLAKSGYNKPSHGHSDMLSIIANVKGLPFLVDSGCFTYTGSRQWHDKLRATAAHNTVTIDDRDQCGLGSYWYYLRYAKVVSRDWRIGKDSAVSTASGSHDGFSSTSERLIHKREVSAQRGRQLWIVEDHFSASGSHSYTSRLHFHPKVKLEFPKDKHHQVLATRELHSLRIESHVYSESGKHLDLQMDFSEGCYSPEYGVRERCPVLEISWSASGACRSRIEFIYN